MQITKHSKVIWSYLKKYKNKVYFLIVLAILASGIDAVIPYIYGKLVDVAIKPETTLNFIFAVLGLWLFLTLIVNWMNRYTGRKSVIIANDTSNDFYTAMIAHIMRLPVSFHKEKKIGEVLQKISRASEYFSRVIEEIVFYTGPAILEAIIGLFILTFVEWRLSVAIAVVLLAYALITIINAKPIMKSQKILNRAYEKAHGDVYNAVNNIQVIKSSIAEDLENKRNKKNFQNIFSKFWKLILVWNKLDIWQQTLTGMGFVLTFAGGIFLLRAGYLSAGTLVMFVGYINLVFRPFAHLGYYYRLLKSATTSIDRALKLEKIKTERYLGKINLKQVKGEIVFENVSFSYKKKKNRVLKNIDFKVKGRNNCFGWTKRSWEDNTC